MTVWSQKVGQRFVSTQLSAQVDCPTGKRALWSIQRLPSTQISPLVGTSAQIDWALQSTKSSSAWGWCKFLVLHARAYLSYYETALFLSSSHCTVNESSSGFTTPTAARWSFLQSLQIPVNRSALSLGDVQLIISFPWTSLPSNYFHLTSKENNAFAYLYDDLVFPF